jgi:hypothetical protein
VGIVKATYVPVDPAGAWRRRITVAMRYYAHRPGADKDQQERERAADRATTGEAVEPREPGRRGGPRVAGRWFVTTDGERLLLREAHERLLAEVAARHEAARRAREERAADRHGRAEARLRAFVEGAGGARERDRREQLAARWRHAREARERLPDPVFRVYRVVLSTSWAVLEGRDVEHVLATALGGAAGAVAGTVAHAGVEVARRLERTHDRATRRAAWARERAAEQADAAERRQRARVAGAEERRRQRADARFARRFLYVRHEGPSHSHPHVHALFVTDGRGLDRRDLERMRHALAAREALREREQAQAHQAQAHQAQAHERAYAAAQERER